MAKQSLVKEFLAFVIHEKKWWMIPLVVVILLISVLVYAAGNAGALAPFIYPFF